MAAAGSDRPRRYTGNRHPACEGQVELRVPLGGTTDDLRTVRRAVVELVTRCRANVDASEVSLLADEVTSNALRHAGGATQVVIYGSADHVYVEVSDDSPVLPTPLQPTPYQDRGRGLLLLERLASSWGVDPLPTGGKTVWFELRSTRRGDPSNP